MYTLISFGLLVLLLLGVILSIPRRQRIVHRHEPKTYPRIVGYDGVGDEFATVQTGPTSYEVLPTDEARQLVSTYEGRRS